MHTARAAHRSLTHCSALIIKMFFNQWPRARNRMYKCRWILFLRSGKENARSAIEKKRATNKQHGMCFFYENAKQFYAMRVRGERERSKRATGKSWLLSRFFGFLAFRLSIDGSFLSVFLLAQNIRIEIYDVFNGTERDY